MKNFWQRKGPRVSENESSSKFVNEAGAADLEQTAEARAVTEDAAREEADVKKLAGDLEDLRQTLLRRQADFDNYRKRIERERGEDSKRAMARVIEGLIPVLDGFENALAAHREVEYENYRKGFELIYKQLLENITRLGAERVAPVGKTFDPHLHQALDRMETTEHEDGTIVMTNRAWSEFAEANGAIAGTVAVGANYLAVCDGAGDGGDGPRTARGLRAISED